ncbi:uncharacterized protein LOC131217649 [Magnolia sinica]|uniref:uncharacterized protein LOC131217649 n=1 Tax=Magnolia sinica TaxID=86752 RepID=UPI002659F54E|nr:uncharacterized protein LOC131217649 [Magnolia sinica]
MVFQREGLLSFAGPQHDESRSLITATKKCRNITTGKDRSTQNQEFFEFFNDFNSEMCAADDIFFGGKILPYNNPILCKTIEGNQPWPTFHMRSKLLDVSHGPHAARHSFSADYQKLERVSGSTTPSTPMPKRVSGSKCNGDGDFSPQKVSRPKWYFLMFGSVTAPPVKMEMNDIRSRLRRRSPPGSIIATPECNRRQTVSVSREPEGKSCWKLLRVLSCQGHANAVITPSLGLHPARFRAV